MPLTIKLRGKTHTVDSLRAAAELFEAKQDRLGKIIRSAEVCDGDKLVARISQNGNVWPPEEWFPGQEPLIRMSAIAKAEGGAS